MSVLNGIIDDTIVVFCTLGLILIGVLWFNHEPDFILSSILFLVLHTNFNRFELK